MAILVTDCPRCTAARMTFDARKSNELPKGGEVDWYRNYELFCVCRNCHRATTFYVTLKEFDLRDVLSATPPEELKGSLNDHFRIRGFVNLKDLGQQLPPEHVPDSIALAFREGATCVATECWTGAGAMFRKCVDLATTPLVPIEATRGLKRRQRHDLGPRLEWLFDNSRLPSDLRDLSAAIHQDGNDAAHAHFLTKEDAEDLLDFTYQLLERLFSERGRLEEAKARRDARRAAKADEAKGT
jgi:hypothetical protein